MSIFANGKERRWNAVSRALQAAGEVFRVTKQLRVVPVGERVLEDQLALHGLGDYEREYRFHPTRKWRFDFAFIKEKLAVEVEGGIWIRGAHTRGSHFESDAEKYNEALILGWRVLRVSTQMAMDGRAVDWIRGAMKMGVKA